VAAELSDSLAIAIVINALGANIEILSGYEEGERGESQILNV